MIMSSSKRKRCGAVEEAGPSTPSKKYRLTLECAICTEPFWPPVFQCALGHPACSNQCEKMDTKECPSCLHPIGHIPCLAIEKVIGSLWVYCEHGCGTRFRFRDRDEHERSACEYRPLKCPVHGCTDTGLMCSISEHLLESEYSIPTMECCESTQSGKFHTHLRGIASSHRNSKDKAVMFKTKEAWLLISFLPHERGHKFTCESVWATKEVVVKLTLKDHYKFRTRVYSLESALLAGDPELYLFVPRQDNWFDVTVSLIA